MCSRFLVSVLLAGVTSQAVAGSAPPYSIIARAHTTKGSLIELSNDKGNCLDGHEAYYVKRSGSVVAGCYLINGDTVLFTRWFEIENAQPKITTVPTQAFQWLYK